jgi:hypothetical protein
MQTVKSERRSKSTAVVIEMRTFFSGKLAPRNIFKYYYFPILSLTTNFLNLSNGGPTQERLQDAVHQRDEDEASVDDDLNNEESKSGSDD